ncbi:MAG: fumarylacetoacetate hydrolase family protein [Phototrophicaceae bacterium]
MTVGQQYLFGYLDGSETKLAYHDGTTSYAVDEWKIPSFDLMMTDIAAADLQTALDDAKGNPLPADVKPTLKGLLNSQEIWAAGVTYKVSEEARERESGNSNIYTRVYSAARPELFYKANGLDIVSEGDHVGIRADATWSVPEPELTLVLNRRLEVIGFTIGNDMSSRDIEGENPLYLPQAKMYDLSCALGPRIWLQPAANAWPEVEISVNIFRNDTSVFNARTTTEALKRRLPELVGYLGRAKTFRRGVLLLTGTSLVPPDTFTLQVGDRVEITIPPIGTLTNSVVQVGSK